MDENSVEEETGWLINKFTRQNVALGNRNVGQPS